jgi:hypothetical protein
MKKVSSVQRSKAQVSSNEQVLAEIQAFLLALSSYPERFARDPQITFEQHRRSLVPPPNGESGRG